MLKANLLSATRNRTWCALGLSVLWIKQSLIAIDEKAGKTPVHLQKFWICKLKRDSNTAKHSTCLEHLLTSDRSELRGRERQEREGDGEKRRGKVAGRFGCSKKLCQSVCNVLSGLLT